MTLIYKTVIVFLLLFTFSFACENAFADTKVEPISLSDFELMGFHILEIMSIEQVEAREMKNIKDMLEKYGDQITVEQRERISSKPMGFAQDKWKNFKEKFKDGGQIRATSSSGNLGYILIRDDYVVDIFLTTIN